MSLLRSLTTLIASLVLATVPASAFEQSVDEAPGRGFVILQIDALSEPALLAALDAGHMPFVSDLLGAGSHTLGRWVALAPTSTPAAQVGILHGDDSDVPGFRWWDRDLGRLVNFHDPDDALRTELDASGRHDLLHGGASIANMFSGGATGTNLTVSRLGDGLVGGDVWPLLTNPIIVTRGLVGFIDVLSAVAVPVLRGRSPLVGARVDGARRVMGVVRAIDSALDDVTAQIVLAEIRHGTPIIYANLVAYGALSGNAGAEHELSTEALERADAVVRAVAAAAEEAPREYHLIILSDHGQTAGAPFESRYGMSLHELVSSLMSEPSEADTTLHRVGDTPELVVAPSGNLANVSLPIHDHRLSAEEIKTLHPDLLAGLAAHPGIGFVLVMGDRDGLLAIGPAGTHYLDQGRIEGVDPLAPFGPHAAANLRRLGSFRNVGDILVNSMYDSEADEVASFESRVASHGGLGGPQTRAFIIYPTRLEEGGGPLSLVGAVSVNAKLREWRDQAARLGTDANCFASR